MIYYEEFVSNFLQLHNEYRAIHGSPPLQIDSEYGRVECWDAGREFYVTIKILFKLNESAQERAKMLADNGVLEYKSDPEYGENIYVGILRKMSDNFKPSDPLDSWYREGRFFNYGEEEVKDLEHVRHFTQLIWKDSKLVGIGFDLGDNQSMYFVCLYKPPGNVKGQFVENVLPLPEIEAEMKPEEAEKIQFAEMKPDVAKSMERLYSVPSEKLRNWSIWLSKIGEIADEWQRWLRAHIDLSLRLSEQLMAAEEALRRSKEREDQLGKVSSKLMEDPKILQESDYSDTTLVAADTEAAETQTIEQEDEALEETPGVTDVENESDESTLVSESEDREEWQTRWPLGRPWKHLGIEDADLTPPFETLPLPMNEEEMRAFLRKFTHEATVYRSYYQHWKETTDMAIKEITSRSVLATYIVQGKDTKGSVKKRPKDPRKEESDRRIRQRLAKKQKGKSSASLPQQAVVAEDKDEEAPADDAEPLNDEPSPDDAEPLNDEPSPDNEVSLTINEPSKVTMVPRGPTSKMSQAIGVTVNDLVRDSARSAEPVPYIFYIKSEPDYDIAIEHDDEEVIAADTDREKIVGNFRPIYFNLTDKPCKGGKPWL